MNIEALSFEELETVLRDAETAIKRKRDEFRETAICQIREIAGKAGIAVIIEGENNKPKPVKTLPVKYRDDNGNTWTGRGKKPTWLVSALAGGALLEDFAVA